MGNVKITDLPAAAEFDGTEVLPLVQGGDTKQAAAAEVVGAAAAPAIAEAVGNATSSLVLEPSPLAFVTLTSAVGAVKPLPNGVFGGLVWGTSGTDLRTSADEGLTWSPVLATLPATVLDVRDCFDGEKLVLTPEAIYRSTGWAANPATAVWAAVCTTTGGPGAIYEPFGWAGNGTKFIIVEYGDRTTPDCRLVKVSLDGGLTWTVKWDMLDHFNDVDNVGRFSHLHAAEYDKWSDRFLFSNGHNLGVGIYISADGEGNGFTRLETTFNPEPACTTMRATEHGICCGADGPPAGMHLLPRTPDPMDMQLEVAWVFPEVHTDFVSFALIASPVDPDTGLTYTGFRNRAAGSRARIVASDGRVASQVWVEPQAEVSVTLANSVPAVVAANGVLVAHQQRGDGDRIIRGQLQPRGVQPSHLFDTGNVLGGLTTRTGISPGVAVGFNARATGNNAIHISAYGGQASGDQSIGMGRNSNAVGVGSIALGDGSWAQGGSVVIGRLATTATGSPGATNAVVVGLSAIATGQRGIAIGDRASAAVNGTAIGPSGGTGIAGATVTGDSGVAVGRQSTAASFAIAIGNLADATTQSVVLGLRAKTLVTAPVSTVCVVIGTDAVGGGAKSIAIGNLANALAGAVAVGSAGTAAGIGGVAIGENANANTGNQAVSIGKTSQAVGHNSVAIGPLAVAQDSAVCIGFRAITATGATIAIAIGKDATAGQRGVAIGEFANAALNSVAIGRDAIATGENGVAIGRGAVASGKRVAIGYLAQALQSTALALGAETVANHVMGVALGNFTQTTDTWQVAIGSRSLYMGDVTAEPILPVNAAEIYSQAGVMKTKNASGHVITFARQAAIADVAGGTTVDTEARAALNALLASLRPTGVGLIAAA